MQKIQVLAPTLAILRWSIVGGISFLGRSLQRARYVSQLQASFLSASCSGRFDLPAQTMSMRCRLTGELTGEPIENKRFSTKPVDAEVGRRAWKRQPQTSVDKLCRWRDSNPQPLTG